MDPSAMRRDNAYKSLPVTKAIEVVDTDVVEAMRKHNAKIKAIGSTDSNHRWKKFIVHLGKFVEHKLILGIMMVLTLYALFSNDARVAYTHSVEADKIFEIISSITFFFFLFEITITALSKYGSYFKWPQTFHRLPNEDFYTSLTRRLDIGSFYFWLDVLATGTLILEMPWIVGEAGALTNNSQLAGSARVAARAGRIVRLMRMVRHMNFNPYIKYIYDLPPAIQLWCIDLLDLCRVKQPVKKPSKKDKAASGASSPRKKKKDDDGDIAMQPLLDDQGNSAKEGDGDVPHEEPQEVPAAVEAEEVNLDSLVGATMSDLTSKHVIMVVVTMLIFIPILSFSARDASQDATLGFIHTAGLNAFQTAPASRDAALIEQVNALILGSQKEYENIDIRAEKEKTPIVSVVFSPTISYLDGNGDDQIYYGWENSAYENHWMRLSEKLVLTDVTGEFSTEIKFDTKTNEIGAALQSMYTTLFVIFLLVFGTFFFTREVDRLVIDPITTMVGLVTQISKNPLGVDYDKELGEKDGFFEGMETTILLNTINKIGSLMRVGFGEAGASVIAENLKTSTGGRLNLMTGGRMITSIFGFCDVRQFTDTTECLQEEVMLFVNRIGHILHAIVVQCSGSANKNIGDAFLLTWKLEDDMSSEAMALLADQALLTFCRALIELSTYQDFICNFTTAANERLYKRFPGYLVRIGSGLHMGWAIEGAIGSPRKIDASYLSPHVNFTEFLESSTKAYGVPLLISEPFYNLLSPHSAKYVRNVDRIRKPGEEEIGLYTYDSDLALNWAEMRREQRLRAERKRSKKNDGSNSRARRNNKNFKRGHDEPDDNAEDMDVEEGTDVMKKEVAPDIKVAKYKNSAWEKDPELIQLRHMAYSNPDFRTTWDTGIAAYIAGDWPTAEHIFNDTLNLSSGKCGPSKFLLKFIKESGGIAPRDWPGYRLEE